MAGLGKVTHSIVKELTDTAYDALDGFISKDVLEEANQRLVEAVSKPYKNVKGSDKNTLNDVLDTDEGSAHILLNVEAYLREKNDMLKSEMIAKSPEGKIGGEKFGKWRGYTEGERETFELSSVFADEVDPDGSIVHNINEIYGDIRSFHSKFKPRELPDEKKFKGEPLNDWQAQKLSGYVTDSLKKLHPEAFSRLGKEGSEKVGAMLVQRLARDAEYGKFIREVVENFPNKNKTDIPTPFHETSAIKRMEAEEEKEYNVAKFLRPSEVKIPVYRATADHHDLDADIAGVLAREVGIHLGEDEAQVASIIATQMDGDRFRAFAANEGKLTVTKPEIDNYFENYLGRYEDQQVRIGSGEGLAGSEGVMDLKPYAITKGYVQIKKPLDMDDMKLGWHMGRRLKDAPTVARIKLAVQRSGVELTKKAEKQMDKLYKEAKLFARDKNERFVRFKDPTAPAGQFENPSQGEYLDEIMGDLFNQKMNMQFRNWLKDLGFDGIRYKNAAEKSLPDSKGESYIAFDNAQFKTIWNSKMDRNDPRSNYSSGGLVVDGVPTRQDLMGLNSNATSQKGTIKRRPVKKSRLSDKILKAIKDKRGYTDEEVERIKEYSDDVAHVESNNDPKAVQIIDGEARGAGRGKYQFELEDVAGGSGANNTALKRTKRFLARHGVEDTPELDSLIAKKNVDFSTLPEEVQDSIFLADLSEGAAPLDDIAKGKVDKGKFYAKHHWAGARDNPKKEQAKAQWFENRIRRR